MAFPTFSISHVIVSLLLILSQFACDSSKSFFKNEDQIKEITLAVDKLCVTLKEKDRLHCFYWKNRTGFPLNPAPSVRQIELSYLGDRLSAIDADGKPYFVGEYAADLTRSTPKTLHNKTRNLTIRGFPLMGGACAIGADAMLSCFGDINIVFKRWHIKAQFVVSASSTVCIIDENSKVLCENDAGSFGTTDAQHDVRPIPEEQVKYLAMKSLDQLVVAIKQDGGLTWFGRREIPKDDWVIEAEKSKEAFTSLTINDGLCGIKLDGSVSCFGKNAEKGMPSADVKMTRLASNHEAFCGVTDKGKLYCWGRTEDLPIIPKELLAH